MVQRTVPRPERLLAGLELFGVRLGLEAIGDLLRAMGSPHLEVPAVLVAGTNGKGSTAALLAAMASAAGYHTGLYTSPHLESVEERLRVDGRCIPRRRLGVYLAEVLATNARSAAPPPTYFEALTAAAFEFFAAEKVDLAVIEVGLGGRLDATNVCDPVLAVVTEIGLDHQEQLGDTIAAIAAEKAGIVRSGSPLVTNASDPRARQVLEAKARELGAPFHDCGVEVHVEERIDRGWGGQRIVCETPVTVHGLEINLPGAHQASNLALAVRAAEILADLGWSRLGPEAIRRGAAACRWPGRLEAVELPTGKRVLLEAAHNPHGAAALAAFLDGLSEPVDLLFGMLADKDAEGVLPLLARRSRGIVLTLAPSPRARPPQELSRLVADHAPAAEVVEELSLALDRALAGSSQTLLVCGSIYLVGEIRRRLSLRFGTPRSAAAILTGPRPPGALGR